MELVRTTGLSGRRGRNTVSRLANRRDAVDRRVLATAESIVKAVRGSGDRALRRYAEKLDRLPARGALRVPEEEMEAALAAIDPGLRAAMATAAANIRAFAERQPEWDSEPVAGLTVGQRVRALDSVGCYVPGGRHPLPSTLLMTAIPAQVAGVRRMVVVSPNPAPETLAAAALVGGGSGEMEFYRVGGAQAVAALAYGTDTIERVDKIVGPGNAYVTAAKRIVSASGACAIDMLAGPTEILVTSERGDPREIASDLVAQAEHDPDALAVFITATAGLAKQVVAEVKLQAAANAVARQALEDNGVAIIAGSVEEARVITNLLAGEHLTVDDASDLGWVRNAGSVFVGRYSPQAMGDYVSGPNHTLPTGGQARLRGGLSVVDYVKVITVQQYTRAGLETLGPAAIRLAEAEGLSGHAAAVRVRGIA